MKKIKDLTFEEIMAFHKNRTSCKDCPVKDNYDMCQASIHFNRLSEKYKDTEIEVEVLWDDEDKSE